MGVPSARNGVQREGSRSPSGRARQSGLTEPNMRWAAGLKSTSEPSASQIRMASLRAATTDWNRASLLRKAYSARCISRTSRASPKMPITRPVSSRNGPRLMPNRFASSGSLSLVPGGSVPETISSKIEA